MPAISLQRVQFIHAADPAAGAEWSYTVPDNKLWRLRSVKWGMTASAGAANREALLVIDDGSATLHQYMAGVTQIANETRNYTWAAGAGFRGVGTQSQDCVIGIGEGIWLQPGFRVRSVTVNLQAGDNISTPELVFEEYSA